jgi:hypothetical protein
LEKKGNFGDKLARYLAFEDGDMLIAPQLDPGWPKQEIEGGGGGLCDPTQNNGTSIENGL